MEKLTDFEINEIAKKYLPKLLPIGYGVLKQAILHAQQVLVEKNKKTRKIVITESSAEIHHEAWDKAWGHFEKAMSNFGRMADSFEKMFR